MAYVLPLAPRGPPSARPPGAWWLRHHRARTHVGDCQGGNAGAVEGGFGCACQGGHISVRVPGGSVVSQADGCAIRHFCRPVQRGRAAQGLRWRTVVGLAQQGREVMRQPKLNAFLASQCFVNQELDRRSSEECKRADFYDEVASGREPHLIGSSVRSV